MQVVDAFDGASAFKFSVLKQKLFLDFSFCPRRVTAKATLEIQPQSEHLRYIHLNCRQLRITRVRVDGHDATKSTHYSNLYDRLALRPGSDIHQFIMVKDRLRKHQSRDAHELEIVVPDAVHIRPMNPEDATVDQVAANAFAADGGNLYTPIKVEIDYVLDNPRDALHYVGVDDCDARYPHVFTRNSPYPGMASCLFPCVDDGATKCIFDVAVRYPRTLGDLYAKGQSRRAAADAAAQRDSSPKADSVMSDVDDDPAEFDDEEKALEMAVICSGELTDDISDPTDASRKTASFSCAVPILPQHIGIALGPFRHVDLSEYRDTQDDERLGSNAIRVHAFCLPGRENEVRNSAMMLARTLDSFTEKYQSYPFEKAYKLAFVDDLEFNVAHSASFSICSSRLLFPEEVWEPLAHTTRILVHAVASQWIGVNVTPQRPTDYWVIVGASWFMAELYLKELLGRNDLRFRQRSMVQRIMELDVRRPSLYRLGEYMHVDPAEVEFMEVKALMVLVILHHRLVKQSGKNGVDRCLWRLLFNARNEKLPNGMISTDAFLEICEKVGHQKLDAFFNQWVYGCGCPSFDCQPTFNKKKQVIQLTIRQTQAENALAADDRTVPAEDVLRESKEKSHGFRPDGEWPAFVGPMTIRIHEADGTPYEHIVDINSSYVKVEIPYNTKYKRLKKNRRERERAAAAAGLDASGEIQEDTVLYMLGDKFETREEMEEWRIAEWSPEDEARMDQEFYEWLRIDADFEWICRANIVDMPAYMYVSQLQQDKDVIAQAESIQWLAGKEGHPLISSILLKTLMDERYFHGIRTMAATVMANSAQPGLGWIGLFHLKKAFQHLYCIPGSPMTKANNFSDRQKYIVQCAIPSAIAKIKGPNGKAPMEAKKFLLDLVRYNDNRGNPFSDDHYIAMLMRCLTQCLIVTPPLRSHVVDGMEYDNYEEEEEFKKKALDELSRHQRLDEWIPTYQNVYTVTALDCSLALMKNKVTPLEASEFLPYARVGNADNVRLKAWECLIQAGAIRNPHIIRYMVHSIATDPSPYFRASLIHILDIALGQIAVGAEFKPEEIREPAGQALAIEIQQDDPTATTARQEEIARKKLEGALVALKADMGSNEALKSSLEKALHSTVTSASDVVELLEICQLLYKSKYKLDVTLKLPKYWKVEHKGDAVMRFYQLDKYRTRPAPKLEDVLVSLKPKVPQITVPPPIVPQSHPALMRQEAPLPAPASAPAFAPTPVSATPTGPAPKLKFKLKAPPAPEKKPQEPPAPSINGLPPKPHVAPEPRVPAMTKDRPPENPPRPSPAPSFKPSPILHRPSPSPRPSPAPTSTSAAPAAPIAAPIPIPKPKPITIANSQPQPQSQVPSRAPTPTSRAPTPASAPLSNAPDRDRERDRIVPPTSTIPSSGIPKPLNNKIRIKKASKPRKVVVLKVAREKLAKLAAREPRVGSFPSGFSGLGEGSLHGVVPGGGQKRKAEGGLDGQRELKRASFGPGLEREREKARLIVRLKIGRERCEKLRGRGIS